MFGRLIFGFWFLRLYFCALCLSWFDRHRFQQKDWALGNLTISMWKIMLNQKKTDLWDEAWRCLATRLLHFALRDFAFLVFESQFYNVFSKMNLRMQNLKTPLEKHLDSCFTFTHEFFFYQNLLYTYHPNTFTDSHCNPHRYFTCSLFVPNYQKKKKLVGLSIK